MLPINHLQQTAPLIAEFNAATGTTLRALAYDNGQASELPDVAVRQFVLRPALTSDPLSGERPGYRTASMAQVVGQLARHVCDQCAGSSGPYDDCVVPGTRKKGGSS
ncbi:uncharacterized protein PAC_07887 [Phialocephala subalpina]|uniref:Uncharacterized protein n=1 Tax=Phialocephala subalpina TaxID=576137 RepID=A0A1L7WZ02_9HELO|nr:uncharacterized protein PAC_07887 [Phialocephala subalpina]